MSGRYRVTTIVMSSGERLPMLLGADGLPIFEPMVFSLSEVRARNRASNTIESYLRSVMVLLLFLGMRKIDLLGRLDECGLLSLGEIEELVRICRLPMERIQVMLNEVESQSVKVAPVLSLEKLRMRSLGMTGLEVSPAVAATRLRNIRDYLKWLGVNRMSRHGLPAELRSSLMSSVQLVGDAIDARLPSDGHYLIEKREGLAPEVVDRILKFVEPQSANNPWHDEHCRYRNELIILWLLYLGLRKGELLNIRISDIDFRQGTVTVSRRADDVTDPRKNQPKVKTRGREIPLSNALLDKTNAYIMNHRSGVRGARKHDFLFVSEDKGQPMSVPSLAKLFNVLRSKCPDLPRNIFPHIFRHTWNDRFSEEMDAKRIGAETEKKTRSFLMGWSETSGTAATYTRRHIKKKAAKVSLKLQEGLMSVEKG